MTEKNMLIEKLKNMPPEQVEKVLIFIAGLEVGSGTYAKTFSQEADDREDEKAGYEHERKE